MSKTNKPPDNEDNKPQEGRDDFSNITEEQLKRESREAWFAKKASYQTADQLRLALIECLEKYPHQTPIFVILYLGFHSVKDFYFYKSNDPEFKELIHGFVNQLDPKIKDFLYANIRTENYKPQQSGCQISRRVKRNTYSRLSSAIKRKHNTRSRSYFYETFGYHQDDLKKHLESLFQGEMSWDNYGQRGWHIDHKRPVSWFDFTNEEETIKECWALSNLQPMWSQLNSQKGNRYEG